MPTQLPLCPRCEEDWVHSYRFKDDGSTFSLCTECDSFWWPHDALEIPNPRFLDDVVAARLGVPGNPWSAREWAEAIEPVGEGC
ncbi:hypothetical protein Stube_26260 [Streptomyces tubercidicus]|uniref:Transcription factor zinc-finger domain-containing protein n=1 Tax=Streptomyces tubercidicus TaxID=47759 RepID=A0A640UPL3_9ACTN|nr:hypothetical protein Stube_26260 [Streptomyces tubercidicus]